MTELHFIENKEAEEMFSVDLWLAFMVFIFIFAFGCIMQERRTNNSAARTSRRNPRKRKRVTRRHRDDQDKTRRGPEENSDDESYNPRGRVYR